MRLVHLCSIVLCVLLFQSCYEKESFTNSTSARLAFSVDTLKFDTIFSNIGSTTHQFVVYNRNSDAVRTSVSLQSKYYRLNVDGVSSNNINNLEIRANDSAFVFVEVTINPNDSDSPILVLDSIQFETNGNQQDVKLMAFGQDVHLYNDSIIEDAHWVNDRPYLIYNSVLVDSAYTLTIDPGTRIYFHNNSSLMVRGTLHINGTVDEPVIMQGDRLEEYYSNKSGQWGAIYVINDNMYYFGNIHILDGSRGNTIDYAIIKNGIKGIQVDNHFEDELTLTLSNTIIQNMSIAGIYAQNANMLVYNTVISNCGYYTAALTLGGNYKFIHSTLANYNPTHRIPSLIFNNYYVDSLETVNVYDFLAQFSNSIIYGSLNSEFVMDMVPTDMAQFAYAFENCMLKYNDKEKYPGQGVFRNVISDADSLPRFVNISEGDYHLDTLSSAKDKGLDFFLDEYPIDLDGNQRDSKPDLGAYERIEQTNQK